MEERGSIVKEFQVNVIFILTNFAGKKISIILDQLTKVIYFLFI